MATASRLAFLMVTAILGVQMPPGRPPGQDPSKRGKIADIAKCPRCHRESDIRSRKGFYCEKCGKHFPAPR